MSDKIQDLSGVAEFLEVVKALRHPTEGCPWDLAQTHESLLKYFKEEVAEFCEAIESHGPSDMRSWDELGDVCLQIALHAELASEKGIINLNQVCARAAQKLRRRHPHVFDPRFPKFKSADEVSANWEKIKAWERAQRGHEDSPATPLAQASSSTPRSEQVASVPRALPSLTRAARVGEKAASFRFDWPDSSSVLDKIREECQELEESQHNETHAAEELGDLIFACSQYARKRGWDPERILNQATDKFLGRFEALEKAAVAQKLHWDLLSLEELESLWKSIK